MRLICPNCGAQYEVPDEVIPESGRDVQCSNCGDTWFQAHPDHPQAPPAYEPSEPEAEFEDASQTEAADEEHDTPDWVEVDDDHDADDLTAPAAEDTPSRRELDPDVASVLREEATRERQARAAETGGLETQPDLGLEGAHDDSDRRSQQARARMARLRGDTATQDNPPESDDIEPSTRRGLLPDIDDINSTIASAQPKAQEDLSARDGSKVAASKQSTGGFRRGLRLAILLAIIATGVYMFSPVIAQTVPATAEPLIAYVETVNGLRAQLNDAVAPLVAQVQEIIGG